MNSAPQDCKVAPPHIKAHHQEENHSEEICHSVRRCSRFRERCGDGGARELVASRRQQGHLRAASGPEVVGPLGDAGSSRARQGVQRCEGLVRDHERRRRRPEAEDAGRQCLSNGAKVVILVSLDAGSSIAIEKAAAAKGAKVIEYDRQVKGGKSAIYISFDGAKVGVLQGRGVVAGLKANGMYSKKPVVAELNGGQTDNNSYLFKGGYDSILKPLYKNGTFKKGPDQFTPDWDNQKAGVIFEQMLVKTSNKIDAVAAANDGLANAVVVALKAHGLKPIPLSGQDATGQGVQNIISGWQTMTVWKDTRVLATKSALAAIALAKGKTPSRTHGEERRRRTCRRTSSRRWRSRRRTTSSSSDGFLKKSDVCIGEYKKYC